MAGVPNFLQAIVGGYEAGSQQAERSRLRDLSEQGRALTGKALNGDPNATNALAGIDPNAFMQVKKFTQEQKAARLDELASGAMAADTPEKWAAFVQQAEAQGHRLAPGETRESIINQAMGWKEKMAQQRDQRDYDLRKTQGDRSYSLQRDELSESKRYHDASLAANGGTKAPSGYRYRPDGSLEAITGGPADPKVKASQGAGGITTKMHNDAVAVDQAYRNLDTALNDYQALVTKTGVSMVPGQENDQVIQARTNLQLQLKELYNLGVLNGPDLSLMQNMIFDPQTHVLDPLGSASKIMGAAGEMGVPYMPASVSQRAQTSIGKLRGMLKTIRDNKTKGILDENGRFVGGSALPDDTSPPDDQSGSNAPANTDALIEQANDAIMRGADPKAVQQRLREQGIEADFAQ